MSRLAHWLDALRLPTLVLALGAVAVGLTLAATRAPLNWTVALLTLFTAALLQLLANLANDWGDVVSGVDGPQRPGPPRALQRGAISLDAIRKAVAALAFAALLSGSGLIAIALRPDWSLMLAFGLLGLAALVAALAYTLGRAPYGYRGHGDIAVLLFFGPVAVLGSYLLQTQQWSPLLWLPALAVGLLVVAVLNINNIRDIDSDMYAGKVTVASRLGRTKASRYHALLVSCAVGLGMAYLWLADGASWVWLLVLALLVPLYRHARQLPLLHGAQAYNRALEQMVGLAFAFDALLCAALTV